jgi:4'-phosphopantetheinyl transferase
VKDVDIYCFALDEIVAHADAILSAEEQTRAVQFRFARDRRRFINCRAKVRTILARYLAPHLAMDAVQIKFRYNEFGKPSVDGMHFNVSHSHDVAMMAVSRSREVGIDVQRVDTSFANENVPERFFSPREVAALRELPSTQQLNAFFRCWTRKEAYVKARGMGLSLALNSFDVTLAPGEPPRFLRGADDWSVESLSPIPGYAAAVVASPIHESFLPYSRSASTCEINSRQELP